MAVPYISTAPPRNLLDTYYDVYYYTNVQQLSHIQTSLTPHPSADRVDRFARVLTAIGTTYLIVRIGLGLLA